MGRVETAVEAVRSGRNVEIRGRRLAGRTCVLEQIGTALAEHGVGVHHVAGSGVLRERRLGALELAGLVDSSVLAAPNPLAQALEVVRERLGGGADALLVDDADLLDPSSAAVVHRLSRDAGRVVAVSRSDLGRPPAHGSPVDADTGVEVGPLSVTEMLSLMTEQLGDLPSRGLLAEVFTLSLGVAGVARRIVEDGVASGAIEETGSPRAQRRHLQAPSLTRLWHDYLLELSAEERRLLTDVAVGDPDRLVEPRPDTLGRLVELGHLRVLPHRGALHAVVPVLLRQHVLRRVGRTGDVGDGSPWSLPPVRVDADWARTLAEGRPSAAWSSQLYRQVSARRRAERAPRDRARAARILAPHVASSVRTDDGDVVQDVLTVFQRLAAVIHEAGVLERAESALGTLRDGSADADLAVTAVRLALRTAAGRQQGPPVPPDDPARSPSVRLLACGARLFRAVVHGELTQAAPDLDLADALEQECSVGRGVVAWSGPVRAIAAALLGDMHRSQDLVHRSLAAALDEDATDAVPLVVPSVAIGLLVSGRHAWARETIELCLALPVPDTVDDRRSTLQLASTLALWDGDVDAAFLWAGLAGEGCPSGPLPFQSTAWVESGVLRGTGKAERAAALLMTHADAAADRGWTTSAAGFAVLAADIAGQPAAVAAAERWCAQVGSRLLDLLRTALVMMRTSDDTDAMMRVYRELVDHGAAVTAYRLLLRVSRLPSPPDLAAAVDVEIAEFRRVHPEAVRIARHTTTGPPLTARERAVVQDVLKGLTSAEVARRQVVSVRTVESQLHSAMKKLGVSRRSDLRDHLDLL